VRARESLDEPLIPRPIRLRGEDRLAERIFQVRGVRALFLAEDFVTVTKEEDVGWPDIIDELRETILEELASTE